MRAEVAVGVAVKSSRSSPKTGSAAFCGSDHVDHRRVGQCSVANLPPPANTMHPGKSRKCLFNTFKNS